MEENTANNGFADVVLDYFDSGAGPLPGPYGGDGSNSPIAVDVDVVIGNNSSFLSLPTGSFVTVGFTDETVIDGPGNDIFIQEVGAGGEEAEVFVSSNLVDFTLLGIANSATTTAFDLASIGFTNPVQAVKIVGLDSRGGSPGFDVVSVQVLPDSIGAATPSVMIASGIFPSEEGSTTGTFTITLDRAASTEGLILNYSLNGTATLATDFLLEASDNVTNVTDNQITIAGGETTATVNVVPVDDAVFDPDETVELTLTAGVGYNIGADGSASLIIADNDTDSPVGDGFADVVLDYFDSGAGPIPGPYGGAGSNSPIAVDLDVVIGNNSSFLSLPTGSFVTVGFTDETVVDGPGNDIFIEEVGSAGEQAEVFVSSNLVDFTLLGIANGATITAFDLASIGFTNPVQAVKIVGLDSRGGSPGFDVVSVQVLPDSIGAATPSVMIASGIFPSEEGSTTGTFTITLDRAASAEGLIFNYSLNGTATLATDFLLEASDNVTNVTDNQITIAGGETTATVNVVPVDDAVFDPDETVELTLTTGVGYNIGADGSASLIIADNDSDTEQINLDIDGNGETDALTDGVAAMRYLFQFRGDALIDNVIGVGATRTTALEITNYLDMARETMLDVDGNGMADALTDGIMIIRYLFGFGGNAVIDGALGPDATRTTAAAIIDHLQSFDIGF